MSTTQTTSGSLTDLFHELMSQKEDDTLSFGVTIIPENEEIQRDAYVLLSQGHSLPYCLMKPGFVIPSLFPNETDTPASDEYMQQINRVNVAVNAMKYHAALRDGRQLKSMNPDAASADFEHKYVGCHWKLHDIVRTRFGENNLRTNMPYALLPLPRVFNNGRIDDIMVGGSMWNSTYQKLGAAANAWSAYVEASVNATAVHINERLDALGEVVGDHDMVRRPDNAYSFLMEAEIGDVSVNCVQELDALIAKGIEGIQKPMTVSDLGASQRGVECVRSALDLSGRDVHTFVKNIQTLEETQVQCKGPYFWS